MGSRTGIGRARGDSVGHGKPGVMREKKLGVSRRKPIPGKEHGAEHGERR